MSVIFNRSSSLKCFHVYYLVIAAFIWIGVSWICAASACPRTAKPNHCGYIFRIMLFVQLNNPWIKSLKWVHLSGAEAERGLWEETYPTNAGVLVRFLDLKYAAGVSFWPDSASSNQIHISLEVSWPPSVLSALRLSRHPVTFIPFLSLSPLELLTIFTPRVSELLIQPC